MIEIQFSYSFFDPKIAAKISDVYPKSSKCSESFEQHSKSIWTVSPTVLLYVDRL